MLRFTKSVVLVLLLVAWSCAVLLCANSDANSNDENEVEIDQLVAEIMTGVQLYAQNPSKGFPPELIIALIQLKKPTNERSLNPFAGLQDVAFCAACNAIVQIGRLYIDTRITRTIARTLVVQICILASNYDDITCGGLFDLEIEPLYFIFKKRPLLKSSTVCGTIFQERSCHKVEEKLWSVNVAPGVSAPKPLAAANEDTFKIIQITDIHYDPTYEPDSNVNCKQPICCSKYNGYPNPGEDGAGFWGNYKPCDMPAHSVHNLLEQIANHGEAELVYFTGDVISHRVWNTSFEDNANTLRWMYQTIYQFLGELPFYPILGNHEPHPLDLYAPTEVNHVGPKFSTQWLYDLAAEEWSRWLPEEALQTIRRGGFYTVLHKPGFRVVALNSNMCYVLNWWLLYDEVDPYGQLQWLSDTLELAEANGERVHILSHIPPGDPQCLKQWGKQFRRIVNRYSNTITAHFNGHTHFDELRLFYGRGQDSDKVINVAYNGGSFTTYLYLDPNYRVYDVSNVNMEVVDFHEYVFDLGKANRGEFTVPEWYELYSFASAFDMDSASLDNLQQLPLRMLENRTLLEQYRRLKYRNSDYFLQQKCDDNCMMDLLCEIVVSEYGDNKQCEKLTSKWRI